MKKYLALLAAALMVAALAACGKTDIPAAPETSGDSGIQGGEATPTETIDYSKTDISEWVYSVTATDEEIVTALMTIDMTEHGSAGSSMKEAIAAANVLKLIGNDKLGEKAAAYLDGMTALQRDYFSFQWQMAVKGAEDILKNFDSYKELLSDAGYPDFSIEGMTTEGLELVKSQMSILLADRNVTDAWKGFTDLEPFMIAG